MQFKSHQSINNSINLPKLLYEVSVAEWIWGFSIIEILVELKKKIKFEKIFPLAVFSQQSSSKKKVFFMLEFEVGIKMI